jgi:hypothetical protein
VLLGERGEMFGKDWGEKREGETKGGWPLGDRGVGLLVAAFFSD